MRHSGDGEGEMTTVAARVGVLALTMAALAGLPAQAEGSGFRNAMPYAEARETFRRLGYKPYFMPGADICDTADPRCYPELVSCAKSRTWACTYTWRRGRAIIEVETRYDNPVVARSDCIVNCTAEAAKRGGRLAERMPPQPQSTDEPE
jgi:hypothetical protein